MKSRFVAIALLLGSRAPTVFAKPKQAVPKAAVSFTSTCANAWQPLLEFIDDEYAITFIYDPWHRVSFYKVNGSAKVSMALGGAATGATVQLRSETGADSCVAEIYGDTAVADEVAEKFAAKLPGATVVQEKHKK